MTEQETQRQNRLAREIPKTVKHGRNCYVNWGCHCDICRSEHAAYMKNYRKKIKEAK